MKFLGQFRSVSFGIASWVIVCNACWSDPPRHLTADQIADQIEVSWSEYQNVEIEADLHSTRNSNFFGPGDPILVEGDGRFLFRSDGERWYFHENSFSVRHRTNRKSPTELRAAFDGLQHVKYERNTLTVGEEDLTRTSNSPSELFWKSGISASWLLSALRRPEAKVVEQKVLHQDVECVHVVSQWKPDWDELDRHFDIYIAPDKSWLPVHVTVQRGGKFEAEFELQDIQVDSHGRHFPGKIVNSRPQTDTRPRSVIEVKRFTTDVTFHPDSFTVNTPPGTSVVDHTQGYVWRQGYWWDQLRPWLREKLDWPPPNLRALEDLQSFCDPKLAGHPAPPLQVQEWLNFPGPADWNRPQRNVTVIHFFGGRLIHPTPATLKALDHLQQRYRDGGLEVIGIAAHNDHPELAQQAAKELQLSFPVAFDSSLQGDEAQQGSNWGATFAAFGQQTYMGTVVIDRHGNLLLVEKGQPKNGVNRIEQMVREQILGATGSADPPLWKQRQVNFASRILRGRQATGEELGLAVQDDSPFWLDAARQRMMDSLSEEDVAEFRANRIQVDRVLEQLHTDLDHNRVLNWRIESEWKRRAAESKFHRKLHGTVTDETGKPIAAQVVVTPVFYRLMFNSPSARMMYRDNQRHRKVQTDAIGRFVIEDLAPGEWTVNILAPDKSSVEQTVYLVPDDAAAELHVQLLGTGAILGVVVDAMGNHIAGATIRPLHRIPNPSNPDIHTTAKLPTPATTDAKGEFVLERLYSGAYVFEISVRGKTVQTKPIPTSEKQQRIEFVPKGVD